MTALYGEPTTNEYEDNMYESFMTLDAHGCIWEKDDCSYLELRYAKMYSSFTGTMENVYLTYAYNDQAYIEIKTNAEATSEGDPNMDVGQVDGLRII